MSERRPLPWSTLAFGLLVAGAGALFLLDEMDRLHAGDWLRWWPVALLVFAVASLAEGRWVAALLWAGFGTAFLLPKLGYRSIDIGTVFDLVPLLLTAAGVALVWQSLRPAMKDRAPAAGSVLRALAVMGGNAQTVASSDFLGGDAVAVMGGCEIDLRGAKVPSGEAVIDVTTIWGGIEIRIPEDWTVVSHVTPLLGTVENKTNRRADGATRLRLRGTVIMAGLEVSH